MKYKISEDYERMFNNIIRESAAYLEKNRGLKSMVVGLSGGIDSALTCALARNVADKTGITLIGRSLPCITNAPEESERGAAVGDAFCHDFKTVDLEDAFLSVVPNLEGVSPGESQSKGEKIRLGNIKARLRMIQLFHLAHLNRGMVLSTDNFTELLLGFWTLHGDVGNYGMIQNLWKTEVYGLAQWIIGNRLQTKQEAAALQSCVEALPTDGLGITRSDFDQIFPEMEDDRSDTAYGRIDRILLKYLNGDRQYSDHIVIKKYLATEFKRNDPFNIPRENIFA